MGHGEVRLEELCAHITDGKHGDCEDQPESGFYFLSCKDVADGKLLYDGARQITQTDFSDTHRRTKLDPFDILITNSGTIGRMAVAPLNELTTRTTFQKSVAILKPIPARVEPRFLYYLLQAERDRLIAFAGGTAQKNLLLRDLRAFTVVVPSRSIQHRIASILSAYDDLIENNTRRIKILEDMAQMLYREWFVNFRFPGHTKVKMVESELGPTPKGWTVEPLADVYKTGSGGTPSRKIPSYYGGAIPWVKTQELQDCFIHDTDEKITEEGLKNSSAKLHPPGTVLMAMYGATIGKLGMLVLPATCNQACCAITTKQAHYGPEYIFLALLNRRTDILALRMGAAQQNISQEVIKAFPLMRPNSDVMVRFNETVAPLMALIGSLQAKNANLRTTRDLLLPKLISGEISIEAAAELTEQAV